MRMDFASRVQNAVYHSKSETRKREYEQKRQERLEQERADKERRIQLETALWDASDAVWCIEQVKKTEGPKEPGEQFSERYRAAVKWELPMKEYRDRLFDELYGGNQR